MADDRVLTGILIDEQFLTIDELAQACRVERQWVVVKVQSGLLGSATGGDPAEWRFASADLVRARRLAALERDFDANEELAALVADLIEEVQRLRARLRGG